MSPLRFRSLSVAGLTALAAAEPLLAAQGTPPFEIMTVPAGNVGTCLGVPGADASLRSSRLVIKSMPPGSSRAITVMADTSGRTVTYSDAVFVMRSATSGVGRNVIAVRRPDGRLEGLLQESEHTVPAVPHDVTGLRTLRDSMKTDASRRALTAAELRQVSDVIAFVRRRCSG